MPIALLMILINRFGNPAIFVERPVAFRPCFTTGLAIIFDEIRLILKFVKDIGYYAMPMSVKPEYSLTS